MIIAVLRQPETLLTFLSSSAGVWKEKTYVRSAVFEGAKVLSELHKDDIIVFSPKYLLFLVS